MEVAAFCRRGKKNDGTKIVKIYIKKETDRVSAIECSVIYC